MSAKTINLIDCMNTKWYLSYCREIIPVHLKNSKKIYFTITCNNKNFDSKENEARNINLYFNEIKSISKELENILSLSKIPENYSKIITENRNCILKLQVKLNKENTVYFDIWLWYKNGNKYIPTRRGFTLFPSNAVTFQEVTFNIESFIEFWKQLENNLTYVYPSICKMYENFINENSLIYDSEENVIDFVENLKKIDFEENINDIPSLNVIDTNSLSIYLLKFRKNDVISTLLRLCTLYSDL